LAVPLVSGCSDLLVLDPKGPVGEAEREVIVQAFGLMLIVVTPVIALSLWLPWRYRVRHTGAAYRPDWSRSHLIEWLVWLVPAVIILALGTLVWTSTHRLDPYRPIESKVAPMQVQAVSLDWKWLFIYPEIGIATVNRLVFPAKTPLSLHITSDSVMTSFFVPQLGSQIYAMPGMQTRLRLMADTTGNFLGENAQFSGAGFPYMHFDARATTPEEFDRWVEKVRHAPQVLDTARLAELEKPSAREPVAYFSGVSRGLFASILDKHRSAPSGQGTTRLGAIPAAN